MTETRCQPIAIRDVLHYLVAIITVPLPESRIFEIGGPDILTYRQMMDRYAEITGLRKRVVLPVPFLTPSLSSHWLNLVTPLPIGPARPLVEWLVNDVVVRQDRDIRRVVDHEPIPLNDAIRLALAIVQDLTIKTSWMDSVPRGAAARPMPQNPAWAGGTIYEDRREISTAAPAEQVFAAVTGVGGTRGWYVANRLWSIRGVLDKLIGGVGGGAVATPTSCEWETRSALARFHPRRIAGRLYWWALLPIHKVMFRLLAERLIDASTPPQPMGAPAGLPVEG